MSKTDKKTEIIADQLIISEDQNTIAYKSCIATFKPIREVTKNTCSHCWFDRFPEACSLNICSSSFRKDEREGIFTIQEMPEIIK